MNELRADANRLAWPPRWLGWVDDEQLQHLISTAAIVVVPYRRSNPASGIIVRSIVEGRAVIATHVPAALDAITDEVDGLLVEPGDVGALAGALEYLLVNPELRDRLGDAAATHGAARFTWERHLQGLTRAYAIATGEE
jgi:glycosyltransferase involved in cell wall biosynthesis